MVAFICNREVRLIPKGWQHPKDTPLLPAEDYPATPEAQKAWMEEMELPTPPSRDEYMPSVEGLAPDEIEIMAYETTSEGTPISPAFPNTEAGRQAMVEYCATNATTFAAMTADVETWRKILFVGKTALVEPGGEVSFPQ